MSDKMREEFEAWECDSDDGPQTDRVWLMYDEKANEYPLDKIQARWEVWQASRSAVVIELPPSPYMPDVEPQDMTPYEIGEAQGRCDMWSDSRKAIEAAGVKCK